MFTRYLKQNLNHILIFIIFISIFIIAFFLYDLPLSAILYPALVCSVIGLCMLITTYHIQKQKHQRLEEMQKRPIDITQHLPKADTIAETDYQVIIQRLCEEQRREKNEAEEKYSEMVEYYSLWAHQIKTPIASMGLMLQHEDSALSRSLTSSLNRIEQYVEMVLTFLRLDADSTDYVFRACSLDAVIRNAVRKFSGDFILKRLALHYEPMDVVLVTDEKWLSFVIEQVLSNALKYTSVGGITIAVSQSGKIEISDTGIGIAPEDLKRIFEKGYTGYNGRRDQKASGIGLYLCKRICDNLGMTITASSQPDHGTVIIIEQS